jgi:iron complex outermembrane receptor protein
MVQQELKKHLIIQTGVRYDYRTLETDETGLPGSEGYRKNLALDYGNFSGSAGATLQLNECVHVRANIAKAYRTPNLAELSSNGPHETRYEMGDQKLVPENSAEADLSLHLHTNTMTADLAVFRNIIHDYIFIAPTSDTASSGMRIYRYQQDDARLQGGEAGIHLHPGSVPWLHIEATCSLVNGEHTGGEPLPFIPPLKASLEGRVEKEKLGMLRHAYISAKSSFAAKQQRPANDETETNGYALLDIAAGAEITLGRQLIRTDLGISNLFDTTYIDHLSTLKEVNLYNPGRNLTLNVQVPFGCTRHPKEQKSLP